jgi:hypothetical protein
MRTLPTLRYYISAAVRTKVMLFSTRAINAQYARQSIHETFSASEPPSVKEARTACSFALLPVLAVDDEAGPAGQLRDQPLLTTTK